MSWDAHDFYIAVVRPVLEYCAPVWHYALTKAQTQELRRSHTETCYSHYISLHQWNAILLHVGCYKPLLVVQS